MMTAVFLYIRWNEHISIINIIDKQLAWASASVFNYLFSYLVLMLISYGL